MNCEEELAKWMKTTQEALALAKFWRERAMKAEFINAEWIKMWDEHIKAMEFSKN